ncbi:MAG: sodium:solute symporter family protein [Verrucomicrobiota bacterium]
MTTQEWTYLLVGITFAIYIGIAIVCKVGSTKGFYVAGHGVPPVCNGMATAADWMSAASFLSMAGLISFMGSTGCVYLLGWTGGYVLLALLLAPYLRKFGKFTVPDFVGDRYYSNTARFVAVLCAIFISLTYIAGQMRGVGIVFANILQVPINTGVIIGMVLVFCYATMGGMKGITWTQVAQYIILILAYLIPACAISHQLTGHYIPQIGFGSVVKEGPNAGIYLLELVDKLHRELGLPEYTAAYVAGKKSMIDVFCITMALMVGTAGLPHVIIRFYTVKTVSAARWSALWALLFIGLLYTTAPAIATFARANLIQTVHHQKHSEMPVWFKKWENSGLIQFEDKNGDGHIQYFGKSNQENELIIDRDIMVLANPEIANLPSWVVALVAAGALAAALSTAAGLLLVISSSISHDLFKRILKPDMTDAHELAYARVAAGAAVIVAGLFGIYPPGFVGEVVAFAFGLAASSFFPAIILGIFSKRTSREGAIAGMLCGIAFTGAYIIYFRFINTSAGPGDWLFGISPQGIGTIGMLINFAVTMTVTRFTPAPPPEVQSAVERIRYPRHSHIESLDI